MKSSTLVKFITTLALAGAVSAHGEEHDPANGEATYAELHMAQEVSPLLSSRPHEVSFPIPCESQLTSTALDFFFGSIISTTLI